MLTHEELLDTIGGTDLRNLLDNLRIVVTSIAGNDEGSTLSTLRDRQEDTSDEGFAIAGLLEDLDLLAKTRTIQEALSAGAPDGHQARATYVPGFWSWKGWTETVWTDMVA